MGLFELLSMDLLESLLPTPYTVDRGFYLRHPRWLAGQSCPTAHFLYTLSSTPLAFSWDTFLPFSVWLCRKTIKALHIQFIVVKWRYSRTRPGEIAYCTRNEWVTSSLWCGVTYSWIATTRLFEIDAVLVDYTRSRFHPWRSLLMYWSQSLSRYGQVMQQKWKIGEQVISQTSYSYDLNAKKEKLLLEQICMWSLLFYHTYEYSSRLK